MSEPKLVSPLLDGFLMGNAMSEHDGIRCYPAMKEGSEEKYIVKVISVPGSQVQLDALLLTGAYKDPADAMDYFTAVSNSIVREAEILQELSRLDGFLSYEGWQIVPMESGRLGYDIYLLASYKRSLERHFKRSQMTHLEAVNLGLDLCQALAICRRGGYMYVDLKPSNIFISKNKEYRIADIGFVSLNSMQYNSLPGKYFSAYSAPEGKDPLTPLNLTMDTYSAGMVLYQVFNDGVLPNAPADPSKAFLPPVNADYEISGIIMKAISPDPKDRWKDPMEMGQALVGYMQRNSINNTPLAPRTELITDPDSPALVREAAQETKVLPTIRDIPAPAAATVPVESETVALPRIQEIQEPVSESVPEPAAVSVQEPDTASASIEPKIQEDREEAIAAQISSLFASEEETKYPEQPADHVSDFITEEDNYSDDDLDFENFMDPNYTEDNFSDEDYPEEEIIEDVPELRPERRQRKPVNKKLIGGFITVIILALLGCCGMWYYQNLYLQNIEALEVVGSMDQLTVSISSDIDDHLLTVTCSDTYGNVQTEPVTDKKAVFSGLLPNSQYKITVEISGFHSLIGKTSEVFNTAAQTNIVSFTAIAGPEDGSVLLNLVVDGTEPETWNMVYSAEGEAEQVHSFAGHSVTIKGLSVGKTYTFTMQNPAESVLTGETTVTFASTELVMAKELTIVSCSNGNLTVRWSVPEGTDVDSWTVRCYNDADYEQVQENVIGTEVTFTDVDTTRAYTVEVTASGMTQPIRTSITSNPITLNSFTCSEEDSSKLEISWEHEGKAPVGGWLLMYRAGNAEKASIVKCDEAKTVIAPRLPNTTYSFEIQAADSTSIFSNLHEFTTAAAEPFEFEGLHSEKVVPHLLVTPENQDWTYESISNDAFKETFASGEAISVVLHGTVGFYIPDAEINALYVIRDKNGLVCEDLVTQEELNWKDLWYDGDPRYGELDLPVVPTAAGNYTVEIYFNNKLLTTASFTIQ